MPFCKILHKLRSVRLYQANAVQKYQMLVILCAIHCLQLHSVHAFAEPLTGATRYHRLELLEISHHSGEGLMRLFFDVLKQPIPLLILILTAFVTQNEVDLTQCRRRCPYNFGVFARPFVIQYT